MPCCVFPMCLISWHAFRCNTYIAEGTNAGRKHRERPNCGDY